MHLCKHYVPCCATFNDIMLGMVVAHHWIQVTLDPTTYTPWKSFNTLEQGGQYSLLPMVLSMSYLCTDQYFIISTDRQTSLEWITMEKKVFKQIYSQSTTSIQIPFNFTTSKNPNIAFVQASQVISHMFLIGCQSLLHDSFYQIGSSRALLIQIL